MCNLWQYLKFYYVNTNYTACTYNKTGKKLITTINYIKAPLLVGIIWKYFEEHIIIYIKFKM